jgi:hypothetical protein
VRVVEIAIRLISTATTTPTMTRTRLAPAAALVALSTTFVFGSLAPVAAQTPPSTGILPLRRDRRERRGGRGTRARASGLVSVSYGW